MSAVQSQNPAPLKPKLFDRVRSALRAKHYSPGTEEVYVSWVYHYIVFHKKRHPKEMGAEEIIDFLTHLAVNDNVSASTQIQARSAILFLYREVLEIDVSDLEGIVWAKKPKRLPVLFSHEEALEVIAHLDGMKKVMAQLLYGAGLRLAECLNLRVKDIDFGYKQITVRDDKGIKDRVTTLLDVVISPLKRHLKKVEICTKKDLNNGFGSVYMPYALEKNVLRPRKNSNGNLFANHTNFE